MTKKKESLKIFNWIKYTRLYLIISGVLIIAGIYALVSWGLPLGLDFTGGALIEYRFSEQISNEEIESVFSENGIEVSSIQSSGENEYLIKTDFISDEQRSDTLAKLSEISESEELRFQNIGPSVSRELVRKTIYAILFASVAILLWVAYQFRGPVFGVSAILAMLHDSFILVGSFAILGHFYDAEIDFLFVTAVLTTLSFSVHDTIVVFDRIREIRKIHGGEITEIANRAITETMRRSIVNSLTIIFVLLALTLFGGQSIRWFAAALLTGAVLGTYSSPFVAVPILVYMTKTVNKLRSKS